MARRSCGWTSWTPIAGSTDPLPRQKPANPSGWSLASVPHRPSRNLRFCSARPVMTSLAHPLTRIARSREQFLLALSHVYERPGLLQSQGEVRPIEGTHDLIRRDRRIREVDGRRLGRVVDVDVLFFDSVNSSKYRPYFAHTGVGSCHAFDMKRSRLHVWGDVGHSLGGKGRPLADGGAGRLARHQGETGDQGKNQFHDLKLVSNATLRR